MASEGSTLRGLLTQSRDGEWGNESPTPGTVPMRVIRGTDFDFVRTGDIRHAPIRYIESLVAERKALRDWDILIETAGGSRGKPTGRTVLIKPALLRASDLPVTCASFARFIRVDSSRADPEFIYWFLQSLYQSGAIEKYQVQHTGIARFQFTNFAEVEAITTPPLAQQRIVSRYLGALDDKIELNRKMSATLEEMARALFKSWFVDFDPVRAKAEGRDPGLPRDLAALLPDSFEASDLGKIPRGWRVTTVAEEFRLTMGQSPPGHTYNEKGLGMPFYQGTTDFGFRYPVRRVYCTACTRTAEEGDTLVSVRAPVGVVNMAYERCGIGRGVAAICHRSGSRCYTYYAMNALRYLFDVFEAEGTVFGSIGGKDFRAIQHQVPAESAIAAFERVVAPIEALIASNSASSGTLAALRDTLLPKLISGELRVKEAERMAERAG